jgi:hypothetical protein
MANLGSMVQAVENWAFLEGAVKDVRPSDIRADLDVVDLAVERVDADEPFPSLFNEEPGTVIGVVVPHPTVEQLDITAGMRLRCRVRKVSPFRVFADPSGVTVLERPARP